MSLKRSKGVMRIVHRVHSRMSKHAGPQARPHPLMETNRGKHTAQHHRCGLTTQHGSDSVGSKWSSVTLLIDILEERFSAPAGASLRVQHGGRQAAGGRVQVRRLDMAAVAAGLRARMAATLAQAAGTKKPPKKQARKLDAVVTRFTGGSRGGPCLHCQLASAGTRGLQRAPCVCCTFAFHLAGTSKRSHVPAHLLLASPLLISAASTASLVPNQEHRTEGTLPFLARQAA